MAWVEPPNVQDFWAKLTSENIIHPNFEKAEFEFDLDGKQPKVCCLYIIRKEKEYCYVVSQEKLDNFNLPDSTSHMRAMTLFLTNHKLHTSAPDVQKCNFIVGFYFDVGVRKATSCANYFSLESRTLKGEIEEAFEKNIFPKIDVYFTTHVTQCQGTTKKRLQCKRIIKKGFRCHHHDEDEKD